MSNMGATRLILINPQCSIDYETQQAAATGQFALQNRVEFKSWDEFYATESNGIRIALTARDGRARAAYDFRSTLDRLEQINTTTELGAASQIYLIFGPEDCGLSLDDVKECHYCCSLPTFGENWSLNLSQAVLLTLFILRDSWGGERTTLDGQFRSRDFLERESVKKANLIPDKTLRLWLETLGFDISKRRINVYTVLKRMFLHNIPTPKELKIFETVLQQNIRRLKEDTTKNYSVPSNPISEIESDSLGS
jgi:tRNA/rRNA methyltransferase